MAVSEETVAPALEVAGILADTVALAEVEAVVLDWMVQVAAVMEATWGELLEQAQEEVVAPAAFMAQVVALLELASEEVMVAAQEAWEEVTAVVTAVASNKYKMASNPLCGKKR